MLCTLFGHRLDIHHVDYKKFKILDMQAWFCSILSCSDLWTGVGLGSDDVVG